MELGCGFRRAGAERGGVRRTSRRTAATDRGISMSVEKILRRSCAPLLFPEKFQTATASRGCPTVATGNPEPQSSKAEASSTSVLPFLNEQLSAQRSGQMFVH